MFGAMRNSRGHPSHRSSLCVAKCRRNRPILSGLPSFSQSSPTGMRPRRQQSKTIKTTNGGRPWLDRGLSVSKRATPHHCLRASQRDSQNGLSPQLGPSARPCLGRRGKPLCRRAPGLPGRLAIVVPQPDGRREYMLFHPYGTASPDAVLGHRPGHRATR